ncbi:MAG: hypothetical protein H6R19_2714, partial [Proteobacteria bacterium]|nr:hypothetical protein [Pseudomonadota bacterium]
PGDAHAGTGIGVIVKLELKGIAFCHVVIPCKKPEAGGNALLVDVGDFTAFV